MKIYHRRTKYNKNSAGHFKGNHHTEEAKCKIGIANKGKFVSDGTRKKMSEAQKGKVVSKKTRERLSLALSGKISSFKGRHHTDEARQKLALSRLGKTLSEGTKDKLRKRMSGGRNPFYGRKHSEDTKRKISEKAKRRTGKNNPAWRGGVTKLNRLERTSEKYSIWRKKVFQRDWFSCRKCGQSGGELNAHHLNNFLDFIELRFNKKNGITLCRNCHFKFYKKYGFKNNTREQMGEFLCDFT